MLLQMMLMLPLLSAPSVACNVCLLVQGWTATCSTLDLMRTRPNTAAEGVCIWIVLSVSGTSALAIDCYML